MPPLLVFCAAALVSSFTSAQELPSAVEPAAELRILAPVVVTATRSAQSGFDLPLSINQIAHDALRPAGAVLDLSDVLTAAPGIVVRNRHNYAQDLQISSRGFGARSTFGVRGVRLYVDGIPATMPDGQGQTSNFDLASAERIEVLRGPFSALYGNSSGGVVAMFTEQGPPGFVLTPFAQYGTHDTSRIGIKAAGQKDGLNHVTSISRFDTDGYRAHSAATRDLANAKLRIASSADTAVTLIGNAVSMRDVQDPLGLTRSQMESNPRGAGEGAELFNTRKSVRQQQLGLTYEKSLNQGGQRADMLTATLYGGQRATDQYLPIPVSAQTAPTSAGGVIDLERQYGGLDLRWSRDQSLVQGKLQWTAGLSVDALYEDRRGYENFADGLLGVRGRLRREERNRVYNFDQYLQAQWEPGLRWTVLAGVRHSRVSVKTDDRYLAPGNGDDSGNVHYNALSPVFGVSFKLNPAFNAYVSYGRGFETPTLNELSYRPGTPAAGFNFALDPARSKNVEAGIKAQLSRHARLELAAFRVDTENELGVLSNTGGRATYQNVGDTKRDGVELAVDASWPNGWGMRLSYSALRAVYASAFCPGDCSSGNLVADGNRIPGVPRSDAYAELSWRHPQNGMSVALEARRVGEVMVDDANSDVAESYATANLRVGWEQKAGGWRIREFVRIDNLTDRRHIGAVIVNESRARYFEPGMGRNFLVGLSASHAW